MVQQVRVEYHRLIAPPSWQVRSLVNHAQLDLQPQCGDESAVVKRLLQYRWRPRPPRYLATPGPQRTAFDRRQRSKELDREFWRSRLKISFFRRAYSYLHGELVTERQSY